MKCENCEELMNFVNFRGIESFFGSLKSIWIEENCYNFFLCKFAFREFKEKLRSFEWIFWFIDAFVGRFIWFRLYLDAIWYLKSIQTAKRNREIHEVAKKRWNSMSICCVSWRFGAETLSCLTEVIFEEWVNV